jgi:GH24 family phage-related lysozyme (muramidase)
MLFSERALQLILQFEGLNQPGKWPGGASGITLGYGYDLGHVSPAAFLVDWEGCFVSDHAARLQRAIGRTGTAAREMAPALADIRCRAADSRRVLVQVSLPLYVQRTRRAFPGFDVLPLDLQGALVSLVYNRGTSMSDAPGTDNRREMRAIRDLVSRGTMAGIADQIRSMKRLWIGKGLDGLLRRRDAEAALVDSAVAALREALEPAPSGLRGFARSAQRRATGWLGAARRPVVIPEPARAAGVERSLPRARVR